MKYVFFIMGILILTLGISFTIQSDLGTSPFDALLVGLSFNVGLSVGSWEIIIALLLICCNSVLSKQKPELLGLLTAFITGIGIDMWLFFLHSWITPELWIGKIVYMVIGLVLIGLGTATYLLTNFAPIPLDRLTLIIQKLTRSNLLVARTLIYLVFLLLALILKGPIGMGTILTVCLGGVILNTFMPLMKKVVDRFSSHSGSSTDLMKDNRHSI
ncbi:YczE/YyaS/YitT family protein [Paenibacillus xylanilyticus]|uniref:YitT family protein n=1 Tax=Paenibacillus xylanilyticus TaxID=248903 RepID=A0A7Y6BU29_9BACL|nr:YitT family protein [Paenibacillus xylanilyticus]NUU74972.1 YitT family protein [Paenibacillus xylanilyticus]